MYLRTEEMVSFDKYIEYLKENIQKYYNDLQKGIVKFEVPQERGQRGQKGQKDQKGKQQKNTKGGDK